MKEILKVVVCVLLAVALSPAVGFWVVALVGASMALLPLGVAFSTAFPKTGKHLVERLFARTSSLSA
jgi:hypothetical protein